MLTKILQQEPSGTCLGQRGQLVLSSQLPTLLLWGQDIRIINTVYSIPQQLDDSPVIEAVVAIGRNAYMPSLPALTKLLTESPFWHRRQYAAGAIGSIPERDAGEILARAVNGEQLYFVRHWIEAAKLRCDQRNNLRQQ